MTNVVATSAWVVAIFPRLFEQIAEWQGRRPARGLLDIGSAGFRGFEASQRADERVSNIMHVDGGHSAALGRLLGRRAGTRRLRIGGRVLLLRRVLVTGYVVLLAGLRYSI